MENIMDKLINMGIRDFIDESREKLTLEDEVYLMDKRDEDALGQRYLGLDLPRKQRVLIDDYIACVKTAGIRYSDISYIAGIKDTVKMFVQLGLLKN
ncbi:MAG: hypothetical protein HFH57_06980 [Lachnospiraceae bacterium]|nr:hypothetical protein [Lachnospiraceae bacterium]